ncbi:hypothetical protein SB00175_00393 [Klebsiella oxytoca]|nr:hypothetical protein SB00175_00393 [Klebsiella oxytoca]
MLNGLPGRRIEHHEGPGLFAGVNDLLNGGKIVLQLNQHHIRAADSGNAAGDFIIGHRHIRAGVDGNHVFGIIAGHINQRVAGGDVFGDQQRHGIEAHAFQMTAGKMAEGIIANLADIVDIRPRF